jgi:hypothetical protein
MKQLITLAIVFTFFSCGNQKNEIKKQIEDQILAYKDSLSVVADSLRLLTEERIKEQESNTPPANLFDSPGVKWEPKYDVGKEKEWINRKYDIEANRKYFTKKIDSLQLELTKFSQKE